MRYLLLLMLCAIDAQASQTAAERLITALADAAVLSGDFDAIKQRGRLRIIIPANIEAGGYLPRNGSPVTQQQEIAEAFARYHQLTPELIIAQNFADMIPALVAGKGDIVVGNLTVTDERRRLINFSVPLAHVREKVLVRKDDDRIKAVADLQGKRVMVSPDSTFWNALSWLKKKKYPDIILLPRPKGMLDEEELDLLVKGDIDAIKQRKVLRVLLRNNASSYFFNVKIMTTSKTATKS